MRAREGGALSSTPARRRILFVLDSHRVGGAEMVWLDLALALDRERWDAALVCGPYEPYDDLVKRAEAGGVRCLARTAVEGTLDFAGRRRFAALLEGFRGVVHFNLSSLDACRHPIGVARGRAGVALTGTAQDLRRKSDDGWWKRRRRRRALGALGRVACLSHAIAAQVKQYRPEAGVSVVAPFLPAATIARAEALLAPGAREGARARLGIAADVRVAACVGLVAPHKNQRSLVERLKGALARDPRTLLLLVGGDLKGLGQELVALAEREGAAGGLRWLGFRDDVLDVLAACDLLVHPALAEGLGRVVQEAHLMGLPVVAYRSGGVPDVVLEGPEGTGALVAPGDAGALVDAWLSLAGDEARRASAGARGRASVLERFSQAGALAAYEALWAGALAEAGDARG